MRKVALIILSFFSLFGFAQEEGIIFQIEELSKPEKIIPMCAGNTVFERLILSEDSLQYDQVDKEGIDYPYHIVTHSQLADSLVYCGKRPFFYGMYNAYSDHRPFVISPDMIWLLISQGFARHVAENSEKLRPYFVNFSGEKLLEVKTGRAMLTAQGEVWETVFPKFMSQIAEHTEKKLVDVLSAEFSTTTLIEQVASQITIMESMKSYFEYTVWGIMCGIPQVTLLGTTKDWRKIQSKVRKLAKYDLSWWTDELEPILSEFVNASQGKVDKEFWRGMFKLHRMMGCGPVDYTVDGWVVKFYPYNEKGERNNLRELALSTKLPDEIVKVDLKYIEEKKAKNDTTCLELWAGFVGVEQNKKDYTLTPKIGWMIREKSMDSPKLKIYDNFWWDYHVLVIVKEFPSQLLELKGVHRLSIQFENEVEFPDQFFKIKVNQLILTGKISDREAGRLKKMFPQTLIKINGKSVNRPSKYDRDPLLEFL